VRAPKSREKQNETSFFNLASWGAAVLRPYILLRIGWRFGVSEVVANLDPAIWEAIAGTGCGERNLEAR
jgi:hypothetical protein